MNTSHARTPIAEHAGTTAAPWIAAFGVWFGFTYRSPALLVGREAAMR